MKKIRYDELYFYDTIEKFLDEIDFVHNTYNSKIKNIFDEPNIEAERYENYLNNNLSEIKCNNIEDVPSEIESLCYKRYLQVKNMKYRNLSTYIMLTYEMFEQFLISIVIFQLKFHTYDKKILNKYDIQKIKSSYTSVNYIEFFKEYNFDFENIGEYEKIKELKSLYNVLKHGFGISMKELKESRPDYFENEDKVSTLDMNNNTIIDDTLFINNSDYDDYVKAIKIFLNQFPNKLLHKYEVEE
jgi:hypothetical protein